MNAPLPPIPAKRYFTIGEVAELCDVKPHVLRYWEQEFVQLRPMKRRGNRRYYQHHEVLMIRRIRELLYGQGFTINGARSRLESWNGRDDDELFAGNGNSPAPSEMTQPGLPEVDPNQTGFNFDAPLPTPSSARQTAAPADATAQQIQPEWQSIRGELLKIKSILAGEA